jgi:rubrerythrin
VPHSSEIPTKRSFAALDSSETLHLAIFIEERNAQIYHHFAELFVEFGDGESAEIASVFWEMAIEERRHSALLQARYAEFYGDAHCTLTEEDLIEFIEVPRLDGDLLADNASNRLYARGRALKVALEAEVAAQLFYSSLAEKTQPGPMRQIYQQLAQMEDSHVEYLQAKLEQNFNRDPGADAAEQQSIH